jgi:hypothetical protein
VLLFQGPDGPPFPFQRGQGIHIPRLARKLKLEPSPLELNGVVVDYDSSTGYMFTAEFLDGRGTTQESAIRVTGEPAGEPTGETACACKGVHGFTRDCRSGLQQLAG